VRLARSGSLVHLEEPDADFGHREFLDVAHIMISMFFLASSLIVIVTPGQDAAIITQMVLRSARRAPALAAVAGMITGGVGHMCLAITGVSLLLRANSGLFVAVQVTGAAVLLCWGAWTMWESFRPATARGPDTEPASGRSFAIGFLSAATNAKVAIFLLVFFPQFVPAGFPPTSTMVVLAAVYLSLSSIWLVTFVELVYRMRERVLTGRTSLLLQRLMAVVLGVFAVRLLLGL
jgi:threonine/homoserine/homoserine lactone efflux protein